ncbi:hypothetical protein H0266_14095 [Halobacillus locisalis]|uniref:Uncharacterized protein n=1 Tax=Halobacillus locisalis TaxID=220753 RepID=A0A838CVR4_9BACI|nr:hypothetical protein [Halobacillus locisalis]MBA2176024.1 hypothetical protein [Halobacillus locisalis]
MKYEKVLEDETLDQRTKHRKSAKNLLYVLTAISFVGLVFELVTSSIPELIYASMIMAVPMVYEFLKSMQSNDTLWHKWEVFWSGRKRLFVLKEVVSVISGMFVFTWILGVDFSFYIGGAIVTAVLQLGDSKKRWHAKNEYLEMYKEEVA